MQALPARYRKDLSYEGAVRSTSPLHPIHDVCEHIGPWFEPGNRVYAMTLHAICPSLSQVVDYNDVTLGDICEAWLACGMRSSIPASRSLAVAIEGIAGLLYIIAEMKDLYTLDDLDELCKEYNLSLIHI